jgi:hypothetical protein
MHNSIIGIGSESRDNIPGPAHGAYYTVPHLPRFISPSYGGVGIEPIHLLQIRPRAQPKRGLASVDIAGLAGGSNFVRILTRVTFTVLVLPVDRAEFGLKYSPFHQTCCAAVVTSNRV